MQTTEPIPVEPNPDLLPLITLDQLPARLARLAEMRQNTPVPRGETGGTRSRRRTARS